MSENKNVQFWYYSYIGNLYLITHKSQPAEDSSFEIKKKLNQRWLKVLLIRALTEFSCWEAIALNEEEMQ